MCIVSRVYEEYQNQQQLLITQYRIDLANAARDLELFLIELNKVALAIALEKDPIKRKALESKQEKIDEKLEKQLKYFEEKRHFLRNSYYLSTTETLLLGIKHGLPVYGALISFIFALAFIGAIFGFAIPPIGIIITAALGVPILTLFVVDAFVQRRTPPKNLFLEDRKNASALSKTVQNVKASFKLTHKDAHDEYETFLKGAYVKKALLDQIVKGLRADPLADTFYADTSEVIRSFWAGLSKGRKAIEMLMNRLQKRDENGHYQDTRVMYIVIIPLALIYAIVFTLNAFVKGFSRKSDDKDEFKQQNLNIASLEKQKTSLKRPIHTSNQLERSPVSSIIPTAEPKHAKQKSNSVVLTPDKPIAGNQLYDSNDPKFPKEQAAAAKLKSKDPKKSVRVVIHPAQPSAIMPAQAPITATQKSALKMPITLFNETRKPPHIIPKSIAILTSPLKKSSTETKLDDTTSISEKPDELSFEVSEINQSPQDKRLRNSLFSPVQPHTAGRPGSPIKHTFTQSANSSSNIAPDSTAYHCTF